MPHNPSRNMYLALSAGAACVLVAGGVWAPWVSATGFGDTAHSTVFDLSFPTTDQSPWAGMFWWAVAAAAFGAGIIVEDVWMGRDRTNPVGPALLVAGAGMIYWRTWMSLDAAGDVLADSGVSVGPAVGQAVVFGAIGTLIGTWLHATINRASPHRSSHRSTYAVAEPTAVSMAPDQTPLAGRPSSRDGVVPLVGRWVTAADLVPGASFMVGDDLVWVVSCERSSGQVDVVVGPTGQTFTFEPSAIICRHT